MIIKNFHRKKVKKKIDKRSLWRTEWQATAIKLF